MSLKTKLSYRSTLLFFFTMSFVITGTYLLFKYSADEAYQNKLLGIAQLSGHFYLEKDDLNAVTHKRIEKEFKKISRESVRLYRAGSKEIYVDDSLNFKTSDRILEKTQKNGTFSFKRGNRQFLSLYYKDNQGDFVIVVSGEDKSGALQLSNLKKMLLFFGFIGLAMHFILTWLLANKTFRPFNKLIAQINAIKGDDWKSRLHYPSKKPDEISVLINEFNFLLGRIESSVLIQRNFLKNASHEIKTPLAIIIGDIEVALNNTRSEEEYKILLHSLKNNGLHLKSIIESLITLSNLEVANNALNNEDIRVDEVLFDILDKKKIEYPDRKAVLNFKTGADAQEDLLEVKGNRHLLFIAINNIVDNAFKFSVDANINITIDLESNRLSVSITDFGIGIRHDQIENIFELFYRDSKSAYIPGHGIGLYLTRQILALHHIEIQVTSTSGAGTTFKLIFP